MKVMRSEMRSTSTVLCEEKRIERSSSRSTSMNSLSDFVARDRIESRGRLVEDQQARPAGEGEQQHRLDVLTAARGRCTLCSGRRLKRLTSVLRVLRIPARVDRSDELHVPAERRVAEQPHLVGNETDVAFGDGLVVGHRVAQNAHFARVGREQSGQQANGGALAGAVRSDEAHDLAGLEVERQVFEREEAERLADVAHLDVFGLGHFLSTLRMARRRRVASSSSERPSCWPDAGGGGQVLVELFFLQFAGEAVDVGHERAFSMAGDDDALVLEVEIGALDGDDADAQGSCKCPD